MEFYLDISSILSDSSLSRWEVRALARMASPLTNAKSFSQSLTSFQGLSPVWSCRSSSVFSPRQLESSVCSLWHSKTSQVFLVLIRSWSCWWLWRSKLAGSRTLAISAWSYTWLRRYTSANSWDSFAYSNPPNDSRTCSKTSKQSFPGCLRPLSNNKTPTSPPMQLLIAPWSTAWHQSDKGPNHTVRRASCENVSKYIVVIVIRICTWINNFY
jgi:hypothetical protein